MAKLTFFPLGNADTCLVDLDDGCKILFDFAHCRDAEDSEDKRIDLAKYLREDLNKAKRRFYDVVAFSHSDDDHVRGSSEFFEFDHAAKYQEGDRAQIKDIWVPAAFVVEPGLKGDARVIREEVRYRLKKGKGVRVFSRPEALKKWLDSEGMSISDIAHLVTDAGKFVPGYGEEENVEVFAHSPFAARTDSGDLEDRNNNCLVVQMTIKVGGESTRIMFSGDTEQPAWLDIVSITRRHGRGDRLRWDVFKVPHHCSNTALWADGANANQAPEKPIQWLWDQGDERGIIVATCDPIPKNDRDSQPPHRQAAEFYKSTVSKMNGSFRVTMEHPNTDAPEPTVIEIDGEKATLCEVSAGGVAAVLRSRAPRAG